MVQQAATHWAAPGRGPQGDETGSELCCSGRFVRGGEGGSTCCPSWSWHSSCAPGSSASGRRHGGWKAEVGGQHRLRCHGTRAGPHQLAVAVACPAASLGPVALWMGYRAATATAGIHASCCSARRTAEQQVTGRTCPFRPSCRQLRTFSTWCSGARKIPRSSSRS